MTLIPTVKDCVVVSIYQINEMSNVIRGVQSAQTIQIHEKKSDRNNNTEVLHVIYVVIS